MKLFRNRKVSPQKYANLYIVRLREQLPGSLVTQLGKSDISIVTSGGTRHQITLRNAYAEYLSLDIGVDDSIDHRVRAHIADFDNKPDEPLDVRNIVPIVRSRDYLLGLGHSQSQTAGAGNDSGFVYRELAGPFIVLLCNLQGENMTILSSGDLSGMEADDLSEISTQNLRRKFPSVRYLPLDQPDGFYFLSAGGTFESSFLLDREFWANAAKDLGQRILAISPTRSTVWFCSGDDSGKRAYLRKAANHFFESEHYPIAKEVLEYDAGSWLCPDGAGEAAS